MAKSSGCAKILAFVLLVSGCVGLFFFLRGGLRQYLWPRVLPLDAREVGSRDPRSVEPDFSLEAAQGNLEAQVICLLLDVQSEPEPAAIKAEPLERDRSLGHVRFHVRIEDFSEWYREDAYREEPIAEGLLPDKTYKFRLHGIGKRNHPERRAEQEVTVPGGKSVTVTVDFRYLVHPGNQSLIELDKLVPKYMEVERKALAALSAPAARRLHEFLDANPVQVTSSTSTTDLRKVLYRRMRQVRTELLAANPNSKYLK